MEVGSEIRKRNRVLLTRMQQARGSLVFGISHVERFIGVTVSNTSSASIRVEDLINEAGKIVNPIAARRGLRLASCNSGLGLLPEPLAREKVSSLLPSLVDEAHILVSVEKTGSCATMELYRVRWLDLQGRSTRSFPPPATALRGVRTPNTRCGNASVGDDSLKVLVQVPNKVRSGVNSGVGKIVRRPKRTLLGSEPGRVWE